MFLVAQNIAKLSQAPAQLDWDSLIIAIPVVRVRVRVRVRHVRHPE